MSISSNLLPDEERGTGEAYEMAQMMLRPSRHVVRTHGIPRGVIREAYTGNPQHREATIASLERTRALCRELGLITPWSLRVWQVFGIWPAPQVA